MVSFAHNDGDVVIARLRAPDLDVLAFAFIALQRHTGEAADGIGDIGIRKAGDHFGGQSFAVFSAVELAVLDGFRFAVHTLGGHDHLLALTGNIRVRQACAVSPAATVAGGAKNDEKQQRDIQRSVCKTPQQRR